MLIKNIDECDFVNYKKISMFIIFPFCTFKCDKEFGVTLCQNWSLVKEPNLNISNEEIINRYMNNPITKSIVMGGLEPFESWDEVYSFIEDFRMVCDDDIVIYTGFNESEILDKIDKLKRFKNIIIKFGRYKPNQEKHYDDVLGVKLASDNQYAKKIS
jgi:pyruvate-formate lyase-activating enzyme